MNTTYSHNIYDETMKVIHPFFNGGIPSTVEEGVTTGLANTGELMIDLGQMIFAPTLSYKVTPNHIIGISALLGRCSVL